MEDGVRELRDLLDRFNEVSARFAEPDADYDALIAEQAKVQEQIDRHDAWALDATLDRAMDALRVPEGDLGAVLGLGFPPYLGGPFRYADANGEALRNSLRRLANALGERFTPADCLRDGRRFYQ